MNPDVIAVSARSLERLIDVLLGGLAIYYGFRLFLVVPLETQGDGRIKLPGLSVVLAKVGPGVFFTAFGVVVLVVSLTNPISLDSGYVGASAAAPPPNVQLRGPAEQQANAIDDQQRSRVQLAIAAINCSTRLATNGNPRMPAADAENASRDAKLALMATVWSAQEWGSFEAFTKEIAAQPQASGPPHSMFHQVTPDCPR